MKKWNNKFAIMQDLAEITQGHVPIDIDNCITADRPPAYVINEDIEDEYFRGYVGDANFSDGPDLSSIQDMLDLVKIEANSEEDDNVFSESNELDTSTTTPSCGSSTELCKTVTVDEIEAKSLADNLKLNKRNMAMQSIINRNSESNVASAKQLLKPKDFLPKNDICEPKTGPLTVSFRRKSPKNITLDSKTTDEGAVKKTRSEPNSFVPSSNAAAFYKEITEKVKIRDSIKEDIWEQTEKEMKIIDERNREEANSLTMIVMENGEERWYPSLLCLPQNRHKLTGECVVCKVLCAKKIEDTDSVE